MLMEGWGTYSKKPIPLIDRTYIL